MLHAAVNKTIATPARAKTLAVSYQWDGRRECPTRLRGRTLNAIGCIIGSRVTLTVDAAGRRIIRERLTAG